MRLKFSFGWRNGVILVDGGNGFDGGKTVVHVFISHLCMFSAYVRGSKLSYRGIHVYRADRDTCVSYR